MRRLLGYEDRAIDDILKTELIDVMYAGECEKFQCLNII
jgi:hypothetical protein